MGSQGHTTRPRVAPEAECERNTSSAWLCMSPRLSQWSLREQRLGRVSSSAWGQWGILQTRPHIPRDTSLCLLLRRESAPRPACLAGWGGTCPLVGPSPTFSTVPCGCSSRLSVKTSVVPSEKAPAPRAPGSRDSGGAPAETALMALDTHLELYSAP